MSNQEHTSTILVDARLSEAQQEGAQQGILAKGNLRRGEAKAAETLLTDKDFLSNLVHKLGHEIGNPLTSIISLATILERFGNIPGGLDAEKGTAYAHSIIDEAWRISGLTEKLVLLLSQKCGSLQEIPVAVLFEKAISRLKSRRKIDTSIVEISISTDDHYEPSVDKPSRGPSVWIDLDQGAALVSELLTNAYEAIEAESKGTETSEPKAKPWILLSAKSIKSPACSRQSSGDSLRSGEISVSTMTELAVTSSSHSPCPFELSSVFEPFVSGHNDQKKLGLGLAAVAAIVSRLSGNLIAVEEEKDGVYLFSVKAILCSEQSSFSDEKSKTEEKLLADRALDSSGLGDLVLGEGNPENLPAELKLLIIDDQETVASAIRKIIEVSLSNWTHIHCRSVDGEAALRLLSSQESFDVILCDLNLSQMSGRKILDFILKQRPQDAEKFAFITGERSRSETQLYLKSSARPYLLKPFEPEELLRLVFQLIKT